MSVVSGLAGDEPSQVLSIALSPQGHLHVDASDPDVAPPCQTDREALRTGRRERRVLARRHGTGDAFYLPR